MNNTNTAARITEQINNPDLAAAYKRIVVTDNAVAGLYDISVEFIRKRGGTPWREIKLFEGLTEEQVVAAACVLRKYCIAEVRSIEMKDHIPAPEKKKVYIATNAKAAPSKKPASGIVAVK